MTLPTHKHQARFDGTCVRCGTGYKSGDWIVRVSMGRFEHLECPRKPEKDRTTPAAAKAAAAFKTAVSGR